MVSILTPEQWVEYGLALEDGNGYVLNKQKAFQCYMIAAEQKDAREQCKVGIYYRQGIGTEKI
jgi:TPR repeat protein